MSAAPVTAPDSPSRYRIEPTVLQALRSPRILTRELLAGLVVAIALIPEAIAFSVVAGVDPRVGLFSSFVLAVVIAFTGGRPAMITAAAGAVALVIAPVSREYGMDYFIATVILAGILQILLAVPGKEIAVSQEPGEPDAHDDVRVAVRDSFRAARRQLEQHLRQQRTHRAA